VGAYQADVVALYGVRAREPATFAASSAFLAVVTMLVPARGRATPRVELWKKSMAHGVIL
jgi:hypothetical protein